LSSLDFLVRFDYTHFYERCETFRMKKRQQRFLLSRLADRAFKKGG
jgi:hypothetical protein